MSRSTLLAALAADDENAIRQLLARDPSLAGATTENGVSIIVAARYLGRHGVLVALAEARDAFTIFEAVAIGDETVVADLIEIDPSCVTAVAVDGFTPLHLASFFAHEAIVKRLLAAGADPNRVATNDSEATPLHSAAAADADGVVRILLDAGADPTATQAGGYTPLDVARAAEATDVLTLFDPSPA